MPELYAKIDTPRGWTGELDRNSCQQFLLHGNQWQETQKSTNQMHDSSGRGNHGVIDGWRNSAVTPTPWGQSYQFDSGATGQIPYRKGMWPTGGKGSFAVSAWVHTAFSVGDVPILTNEFSGYSEKRLFSVYSSRTSGQSRPYLCAALYSDNNSVAAVLRVSSMELLPYTWTLITFSIDYDAEVALLQHYAVSGGGSSSRLSISGIKSGLNLSPKCPLVLGGDHFGAIFDELALYSPIPVGVSLMDLGLACKDATGGANPQRIQIVHAPLDAREHNAIDGGSSAPVGRATPSPGALIGTLSGEFTTRWVPLKRFPDVPGARILVEGENVRIGSRTTDALDRVFNTTFEFPTNNQGYPTLSVANPSIDKWVQFMVVYQSRAGYVDSLHVVQDHNNGYFSKDSLPRSKPVPAFTDSPLKVLTKDGGLILDEELLRCVTTDTEDLESTLEFDLPLNSAKGARINLEDRVEFRNRLYVVRAIVQQDGAGEPKYKVYCERLWYDLLYAGEINKTHWSLIAEECAMLIMADCDWGLGIVEDPKARHQWQLSTRTTRIGALKELAKQYNLEISIDEHDKLVHLLKRAGRDSGVTFLYERDVATATRQMDTTNLLTRIYGLNEIDGDISPVNNGVPYLEDHTWSPTVRQMTYHFAGAQTPEAMKAYLKTYLEARAKPKISYEFELTALGSRQAAEQAFEVGDWVTVRDENLNQLIKSKVVEARMDWIDLDSSRVVLDSKLDTLSTKI